MDGGGRVLSLTTRTPSRFPPAPATVMLIE
jgi:hypothetical protein